MKNLLTLLLALISLQVQVHAQNKTLTLQDAMLNRSLYPTRLVNAQWLPETDILAYCTPNYQFIIGMASTGKLDTLLKLSDINALLGDEKLRGLWGVTWVDAQTIYFDILNGGYKYDRVNNRVEAQFSLPENAANTDHHHGSGKAAFTVDNNLFVAIGDRISPVTKHTDKNFVAGQAIARSEFGITKGTFWSNSGKYLAFYEKDETNVSDYPLLDITTTPGSLKNIKYPMAGQGSEIPAIGIFNTENQQLIYLKTVGKQPDDYLTNLGWDPSEKFVYVAEVNRDQNHMKLNKYDAATGAFVATLFEEKNERYVEPETAPYFLTDSQDLFVWMSERDGFMNLYLYNTSGKLIRQLTKNKFPAKEIVGRDKQFVYYTATGTNATETHFFKVDLKSGKQTQLTTGEGTHGITLSPDGTLFLDELASTTVAYLAIMRQSKDGYQKQSIVSSDNPLKNYACPKPELLTIQAKDGTLLHGRLFKPTTLAEGKKYPVIIYVYGGPHAQMVTNSYNGGAPLWMNTQAEKGYIVFTIDGRGSAHRGFAFESIIHRNLGEIEMSDQMDGVAYLKSLPYVDADKIAVHGWSYGGFMTTSLMLHHPETFKVGVAGGPVTDWKYYEIMYGERYMDRPEQNPEGYKKTALANHVKNLKGDLLLIHGTVDDVVVMQHNLALVKAFIDAGIQVDFFPYPMHPHNVRGKDRLHLMQKVLGYIEEKL